MPVVYSCQIETITYHWQQDCVNPGGLCYFSYRKSLIWLKFLYYLLIGMWMFSFQSDWGEVLVVEPEKNGMLE